jgi:hypothetical protein
MGRSVLGKDLALLLQLGHVLVDLPGQAAEESPGRPRVEQGMKRESQHQLVEVSLGVVLRDLASEPATQDFVTRRRDRKQAPQAGGYLSDQTAST